MPHSPTCTLFPYTTLFRSLPVAAPAHMTADIFLNHMALDKKVTNGKIRLVLLRSLGEAVVTDEYDAAAPGGSRSEEHTSELQSRGHLVCRLLLEKKKTTNRRPHDITNQAA